MKKIKTSFFILTISALISCATRPDYNSYYAAFKGRPKQEVIMAMGPPNRVESDGAGGSILIYEKGGAVNVPAGGIWVTRTFVDFAQVYCDPNGIVYFTRYGRR